METFDNEFPAKIVYGHINFERREDKKVIDS